MPVRESVPLQHKAVLIETGQQITAIQFGGAAEKVDSARAIVGPARSIQGRLELYDIDPNRPRREMDAGAGREQNAARRKGWFFEEIAQVVETAAEILAGLVRLAVRPEDREDRLTRHRVAVVKREVSEQRRRLLRRQLGARAVWMSQGESAE